MLARILIGDLYGRVMAETQAQVDPILWVLNGIDSTAITVSTTDDIATDDRLRGGNRILMQFDNGLPDWGGVLTMPRVWEGGTVKTSCQGIEHMLKYRVTRKRDGFYNQSAGAIFRELLQRQEAIDPLGITFGEIWTGGHPHWPRYHHKSLWYVLDYSLRRLEVCDWLFRPFVDGNHIRFRAEFYERAGDDLSEDVALVEGRNTAEDLRLEEQGAIVNHHLAIAEGDDWGEDRLVISSRNDQSMSRYGLRATARVYPGVSMQPTLEMHARNIIQTHSEPRRYFRLRVTDNAPGAFGDYDLGDRVACKLASFDFGGYDGVVRVMAREYNPRTGQCELVVEEQRDVPYWIYSEDMG